MNPSKQEIEKTIEELRQALLERVDIQQSLIEFKRKDEASYLRVRLAKEAVQSLKLNIL